MRCALLNHPVARAGCPRIALNMPTQNAQRTARSVSPVSK
jgi:hypothetical protein